MEALRVTWRRSAEETKPPLGRKSRRLACSGLSCLLEGPRRSPREEVFQQIGRKKGQISVKAVAVQKQSPSSSGKNSTGLAGSQCRGMQKVSSRSGSFSSFSASRKNHFKQIPPKKPSSTSLPPGQMQKEENHLSLGKGAVVGTANVPARSAGPKIPLHLTALSLNSHI